MSKRASIVPAAEEPTFYSAEGTRLVRLPELLKLTGTTKTNIYNWIRHGKFPRPLKPSPRVSVWRYTDSMNWLDTLETGGGQDLRAGGR